MWMFTCVKENALHRPHNSWLTEEVVHYVALAIVAGSRQAGSYSGPDAVTVHAGTSLPVNGCLSAISVLILHAG